MIPSRKKPKNYQAMSPEASSLRQQQSKPSSIQLEQSQEALKPHQNIDRSIQTPVVKGKCSPYPTETNSADVVAANQTRVA